MTDAPEVPTPEGQPVDAGEPTATHKGRPRPDATVQRDTQALTAFTDAGPTGLTRETLAEKLGVTPSEAYLSIYRLSRAEPPVIAKSREAGKVVWKLAEHVSAEATEPTAPEGEPVPAPVL